MEVPAESQQDDKSVASIEEGIDFVNPMPSLELEDVIGSGQQPPGPGDSVTDTPPTVDSVPDLQSSVAPNMSDKMSSELPTLTNTANSHCEESAASALPPVLTAESHPMESVPVKSDVRSSQLPPSGQPLQHTTFQVPAGYQMSLPQHMPSLQQVYAASCQQSASNQMGAGLNYASARQDAGKTEGYPPPPKRPLTPYMRFNKFMWNEVKASNPTLGVCEISAAIGRLWRELGPEEKQRHNDEYTLDKVRYDNELREYLKATGLHSADLIKVKAKKSKPPPPLAHRPAAAPVQPPVSAASIQVKSTVASTAPTSVDHHQQQQVLYRGPPTAVTAVQSQQQPHLQTLMGLPMTGGTLPLGMPVGFQNMGMLSGFSQIWAAAGQHYPAGLVATGQLPELYGMTNNAEGPPPAHSQQPSAVSDMHSSSLYRYPQNFM